MAGSSSEESGVGRSLEGMSNGQQLSGEALAEWRSSEQVENGITSTSPPYWDTDDGEDCDAGPKPSELYGKYTWKIDKFSQINKRELRSNAFEVGGYKWYILIYPQGCDVCNHLSLFLCVANHDKLLPGWSHFAQFTIAVVNKDPKKSKYSDTLHRFWKKEHDWGWKKFMELSKVLDGFVDGDTLIIKAQVQVIRERPDRPFRCLDCQYRRELVRVYLSNVEQICRRFVEERRGRLGKLIEDKVRWSSLCSFWLAIDENGRRRMSREKSDLILKVAVKQFFIEKEVTSTLVMDSLYSGLKALEARSQTKSKKAEEPLPIVRVEKDMFILVDDVLLLLERAALEPLPPKDEKGPQNRTKDGGSGEDFSKDSIERDERRLTELGRRTIEIFVLAHIFSSKIEIAYQEAVALKRQEELIREEEAAWMTGIEQKAKRGASEKEKKSKKKQGKQKRNNNRKVKDKGKEEKAGSAVVEETLVQPADSDDRDSSSPLNWDTDTPTEPASGVSAIHINNNNNNNDNDNINGERKSISSATAMDDSSSSTCSTDSLPSVMMNPPYKGQKSQKSFTRGKDKAHLKVGGKYKKVDDESDVVVVSLKDQMKWLQRHMEEVVSLQKEVNVKDEVDHVETSLKEKTGPKTSPLPLKKNAPAFVRKPPTDTDKANSAHKNGTQEKPSTTEKTMTTDKPPVVVVHQVPRPSVSMVESAPFLSHSVSADRSFVPQSYRNVMMGNTSSQPPPTFLLPQKTPDSNYSFRPQMGMMLNDVQNPPDEFPHLDIINDLLDDATEFQRPHQLTCQFTYPGSDIDHGPYTSNSCRSERIQSYHDEFQHSYDLSREMMVPQPYMNGHIRNQWHQQQQQMDHLSYLGLRNMDNDGYQYPQYSNLLMGVHAYTVYPPSNGQ